MHTTKPEGLYVCLYGLMAERGRSACIDLKAWLGSAVRPLTRTTVNAMHLAADRELCRSTLRGVARFSGCSWSL